MNERIMNIEKAIAVLTGYSKLVADVNLDGKLAFKVAIESSKRQESEQIEKEQSKCEYCVDDCCPPLDWKYGLDHILPDYIFCPMCGRNLRDDEDER